jgi:phage tail sheath protein FI
MNYTALKTPGVYVNEISIFPPSIAQVPTAVPAFIGYTEIHEDEKGDTLVFKPKKISSFVEYQLYFGGGPQIDFQKIEVDSKGQVINVVNNQSYFMFDSLQMFFANGGGDCYIISVGKYSLGTIILGTAAPTAGIIGGLEVLSEVDEPTMILSPDAVSLPLLDMYSFQSLALKQCATLMDRVGVFDIKRSATKTEHNNNVNEFRNQIGMSYLKYGAVYTPWLKTDIKKEAHYRDVVTKLVKPGTSIQVLLSGFLSTLPPLDQAAIAPELLKLDTIVRDNNFMLTLAPRSVKTYLTTPATPYRPLGFTGDLPSIQGAYDLTEQTTTNLLADAGAEPNAATKALKTTTAAQEFQKLIRQSLHMITFIDDFTFLNPLFIQSVALQTYAFTQIRYSANKVPIGLNNQFDANVTALLSWDATSVSAAAPSINPISATALVGPIFGTAPFAVLNYDVINVPVAPPAASAALFTDNNPTAAVDPSAARINNMRLALPTLRSLFTYFSSIVDANIEFGKAFEKTSEDGLIGLWPFLKNLITAVNNNMTILPPSPAMAGIYSRIDNERGVWKAPANASVLRAKGTLLNINDLMQEPLNVDVDAGKSINVIRVFSGKGVMVWGARTLAGNDNEWRYISVRRFFNMVEESIKKSTSWVVFEPNDANTWVKVKSMIENYLTLLWRQGALAGAKPEEAFQVFVGLNRTMTFIDILEGRMIIRIEMAAVRPAEFIILEFTHKIQTS